jgi:hemolysin activation/secretion protein
LVGSNAEHIGFEFAEFRWPGINKKVFLILTKSRCEDVGVKKGPKSRLAIARMLKTKYIGLVSLIASPLGLAIAAPLSAELVPDNSYSSTCELDSYPFCNQESNLLITGELHHNPSQLDRQANSPHSETQSNQASVTDSQEFQLLSNSSNLTSSTEDPSQPSAQPTDQLADQPIEPAPSSVTIEIEPHLQAPAPDRSHQSDQQNQQIAPQQLVQADVNEPLIPVREIIVTGNTVLPPEAIDALTEPLIGQSVSLVELQTLAEQITQLYLSDNYITSRAIVPTDQDINDGSIEVKIIEGKLEEIKVSRIDDADGRLRESYVRSRVGLGVTTPINFTQLEQELQLLKADPLIQDIRANLKAGSAEGLSILEVRYSEAKAYDIGVSFDNYGNSATGIYQGAISFQHINLTGIGDQIFGSYQRSGDANSYRASYQIPVSPKNGTLAFSYSSGVNPVTEAPIAPLNIQTDSAVYELTYRQPFVRTPREEFALRFGLAFEQSNSFLDGRSFNFQNLEFDDGKSESTVIRFGQDYIRRDPRGAWALRSTFNFGVDAFGATSRDNAPDGSFFSWNGQLLRVQRLGLDRDTLAIFRVGAQLTGDSLLPINRYSVGGPFSVRGYRQNQISGDSGIQGSVEFQFPIARDENGVSVLKLLPFIEAGTVWNSRFNNPDPQTLVGIGSGLLWQPGDIFTFRVDYGIPLVDIDNVSDNFSRFRSIFLGTG